MATPETSVLVDDGSRNFNCLIEGDYTLFSVIVRCDCRVSNLKEEIKKQKLDVLQDIDPHTFELWKVGAKDSLSQPKLEENGQGAEKLTQWKLIGEYWSDQPPISHLHIIVKVPPPATISPSSSGRSNASSGPSTSSLWSSRRDTVRRLYDVLLKEKLVQVQGTPGCGKTTLMNLLHAYILRRSPSALICTKNSWPKRNEATQSASSLKDRLREVDPGFPRDSGITFLLFDEGQDSYEDHLLWNKFFKGVVNGLEDHYRVALFCSYGSPSPRPLSRDVSIPLVLRDAACISLWPREGTGIGILLTRPEFNKVVSRFVRSLSLHSDLLDLIFRWTVGHVGAVIEILRMILNWQKTSGTRYGKQFTVEQFSAKIPIHKLVPTLCDGPFGCGLPNDEELSTRPDVAALFRHLLMYGAIDREHRDHDEDEAIRKCHRYGWIHADRIANGAITRYVFPSPLHSVCLSWKLQPTNEMPRFDSLFDLAFEAICKFKPSQLRLPPRCAGPRSTDKIPEAQYQDEFYRSMFSVTFGNVRISPEFTSATGGRVLGRIDFLIPVMKWGIELTRDGNRLNEHSSRFGQSGPYGALLQSGDMVDYILLDCRKTVPRKNYPNIQKLFHVVFQDNYRQVVVIDNIGEVVRGPIGLLEN